MKGYYLERIMLKNKYCLITPAKNEEKYISKTIQSIICQTVLPQEWIIVNDGSTDGTEAVIKEYTHQHDFIKVVNLPKYQWRNFASKVHAFNAGLQQIEDKSYGFIGNLDADIAFEANYYQCILEKFYQNKKLGLAGGIRYDSLNGKYRKIKSASNSIPGGFQLFRRQCFEEIGGFLPLPMGGEDAVAETMVRMFGWESKSFRELKVCHLRTTGYGTGNALKVKFRYGKMNYLIGYHPLFEIFRCLSRTADKPYILGSLAWISGYFWSSLLAPKKQVPEKFINYLRDEQIGRLKSLFKLNVISKTENRNSHSKAF